MLQGFRNFLSQPYSDEMDAWDWFLFVGFFIVITVAWRLILGHLLADAD